MVLKTRKTSKSVVGQEAFFLHSWVDLGVWTNMLRGKGREPTLVPKLPDDKTIEQLTLHRRRAVGQWETCGATRAGENDAAGATGHAVAPATCDGNGRALGAWDGSTDAGGRTHELPRPISGLGPGWGGSPSSFDWWRLQNP